MTDYLRLEKYSIGVGDRFAHQARAQLRACILAAEAGVEVTPVWNKSNREHLIIGSEPGSTRAAADNAVRELHWQKPYHVDADHIRSDTVGRFIAHADFYTIDVADFIGKRAEPMAVKAFCERHAELAEPLCIESIQQPFQLTKASLGALAEKYLAAVQEAGRVYRSIVAQRHGRPFITEVSMDETDQAQSPPELLLILAALADEGIPAQTVAPKFTGRFNKGVEYVGDVGQFEQEFNADLAVLAHAIRHYGLPSTLKLSVHSGSDKFSIYGAIRGALARFNAGVHLKTAGTTWLEELIGLAESGGGGLSLAAEIYSEALDHFEELCAPYGSVIDIDRRCLPSKDAVAGWSSEQFVSALRHDRTNREYNPNLRQLLHVGYKIAAQKGQRYLKGLTEHESAISRNVTTNLFERHIKPLFLPRRNL